MEENLLSGNLNRQFNQYIGQMQSEAGRFGRSLHQVFSEYLMLKEANQKLANETEQLEVPDSPFLSADQFGQNCVVLQRFQDLRSKVLEGYTSTSDHPWCAFAHPDFRTDEYEVLIRTVRYFSIHLNKFWIEVQSFPLFLNTLEQICIRLLMSSISLSSLFPPVNL